jgi:PST family polysaccharide transporter
VTALGVDVLMGAGATRSTFWIYVGWAVALIPALWIGTRVDGIQGAAIAHAAIGFVVGIPLTAIALARARVHLVPIGPAVVRPVLASFLTAVVAAAVASVTGPHPFVQLAAAGTAGVLAYVPVAVPRDQIREWLTALRQRKPVEALD